MQLWAPRPHVNGSPKCTYSSYFPYAVVSWNSNVGARQKGDSKWEKPVSAKICGFLRFPAKICGFLRFSATPKSLDLQSETKISENLRKSAFRVRFLRFAVFLLARPLRNVLLSPRLLACHQKSPIHVCKSHIQITDLFQGLG